LETKALAVKIDPALKIARVKTLCTKKKPNLGSICK